MHIDYLLLFCFFILVSIAFAFPYTSLSSVSNNSLDDCSVSLHHPLFASCFFPFCAFYLLPLVIIAMCYTRLFFHMKRSSKTITRHRVSWILFEEKTGHLHENCLDKFIKSSIGGKKTSSSDTNFIFINMCICRLLASDSSLGIT